MKLSYIIGAGLISLTLASCNREVKTVEVEKEEVVEKVAVVANDAVDMKVEGMVCVNGCKGAIEKSLNGMAGVEACNIDFEKGVAHITFDNGQISDKEIKTAIEAVNEGAYTADFILEEDVNAEGTEESTEEVNTEA